MKKAEVVIIIWILIGILFWILLWPGASILLIFFLSALSFFYAVMGTMIFNDIKVSTAKSQSAESSGVNNIILGIMAGLSFAVILNGILFKLEFWPGSKIMLIAGLSYLAIVSAFAGFLYSKNQSPVYSRILKRAAIIGTSGFFLFLLPSDSLTDFTYRNHPEYAKALKEFRKDPQNEELRKKLDEEGIKMRAPEHYERYKNEEEEVRESK